MLSEINQAEKDNQHMVSLICGNIRKSREDIRRRKRKRERKANHKRLKL